MLRAAGLSRKRRELRRENEGSAERWELSGGLSQAAQAGAIRCSQLRKSQGASAVPRMPGQIAKRVLLAPFVVREGERERKVSKFEAMPTQAVKGAISNNIRNLRSVLGLPCGGSP